MESWTRIQDVESDISKMVSSMKIRDPDSMRLQSHSFRNSFSNDFESPRSSSPTRNRVSRSQTLPIQALRSDVEDVRFGYTSVITNEVQSGFSAADWSSNFNIFNPPEVPKEPNNAPASRKLFQEAVKEQNSQESEEYELERIVSKINFSTSQFSDLTTCKTCNGDLKDAFCFIPCGHVICVDCAFCDHGGRCTRCWKDISSTNRVYLFG
ncbi:unnamed protein product [Oikopleura dioica]|uniref:RING-type domain-containing protein n=1 Tax=Oikopleura dioica TaxID=34765 RepID=E4X1X4_OIKDI|nr:unnamed protein product [Oikopleura dioica]